MSPSAGASYTIAGGAGFVVFSADHVIVAYELGAGNLLWSYSSGLPMGQPGSPVALGDGTPGLTSSPSVVNLSPAHACCGAPCVPPLDACRLPCVDSALFPPPLPPLLPLFPPPCFNEAPPYVYPSVADSVVRAHVCACMGTPQMPRRTGVHPLAACTPSTAQGTRRWGAVSLVQGRRPCGGTRVAWCTS